MNPGRPSQGGGSGELQGARPSGTLPSTRPGPLKPSLALRRPPSPSRARQAPHPFASRTCSRPRALRCSSGAASCAPRPGPFKSQRATWSRPLHAPKETCHPGTRYEAPEGPKALWHQGACAARLAAGGGTEGRRGLDPGAGRPAAACAGSPRRGTRELYPGGSRRPRALEARLRALSSLPGPAELFFRAGPAGNQRRRAAEAVGAALTEGSWLWGVWFAAPPPRAGEALRPRADGAADCARPPREPPGMVRPHPAYQSRLENDAVLLFKGKLGPSRGILSAEPKCVPSPECPGPGVQQGQHPRAAATTSPGCSGQARAGPRPWASSHYEFENQVGKRRRSRDE